MIFTNARVVLPDGIRDGLELVVEGGRIAEVRERSSTTDAIDLKGNYLAPGFIDLHLHGALGRDTMEATPEAFRTICEYHASGGTTSLLLTTVTAPIADVVEVLRCERGQLALREGWSRPEQHKSEEDAHAAALPPRRAGASAQATVRRRRTCRP